MPRENRPDHDGNVSVKWSVLVTALLSIIGFLSVEIWTTKKENDKASSAAINERQLTSEHAITDLQLSVAAMKATQSERYDNLTAQLSRIERRQIELARQAQMPPPSRQSKEDSR